MKKVGIILLLLIMSSCAAKKVTIEEIGNSKSISVYETTKDFINNVMQLNAKIIIKEESKKHIKVSKIFDSKTELKIKNWRSFWAIEYNNELYFNLLYSKELLRERVFAKLDIKGKLCAVIIDKDSPEILKPSKHSNVHVGARSISIDIYKSKREQPLGKHHWKDKNGNSKAILLIETVYLVPKFASRKEGSFGFYLNYSFLKDLIKDYNIKNVGNLKDVNFERVIEIIHEINRQ